MSLALVAAPCRADYEDPLKEATQRVAEAKRRVVRERRDVGKAQSELDALKKDPRADREDVKDAREELNDARKDLKRAAQAYKKAEEKFQSLKGGVPYDPELYVVVSELLQPPPAQPPPASSSIPEVGDGREIGSGEAVETPDYEHEAAYAEPETPAAPARGRPASASRPDGAPARGPYPTRLDLDALSAPGTRAQAPESHAPPAAPILETDERVPSARPGADRMLFDARRLLEAGRAKEAERAAEKAAAVAPDSAEPLALLSRALARQGRWAEAESAAAQAARRNGRDASAHRALAWAQLHLGKYEEAAAAASRALALNPIDAEAFALRAFAMERLGRRDAMLSDLRRAAALDPRRFERLLERAERGLTVFDPSDRESWRLLEEPADAPQGGGRARAGAAAAAALLALGLLPVWRRANRQGVEVSPMRGPGPARAAADDGVAAAERAGLLGGKYELRALIGRGGMAHVWEAHDRSLGRPAAVKKVQLPEGPRAESRRALALQEAKTLASLRHPNIVDIYEVLDLPEGLFLVFEFLAGKTLQQILAESKRLPWTSLSPILRPVCQALEFAHGQGFVHRDLKPSNVMVAPGGRVKVMDFGIARALSEGDQALDLVGADAASPSGMQLARTSNLVGTPGYRPPEAERGIVSVAFDVYSLGAVTYEAAVGELPPRPLPGSAERALERLRQRASDVPAPAAKVIAAMLEPDLTKRPQSVQYFRCQALDV